jgi:hypothetical protein
VSDLEALRAEADRLELYFTDADLERIVKLLHQARESVRALGPMPTEWLEPSYVFTPIPAAPKEREPA